MYAELKNDHLTLVFPTPTPTWWIGASGKIRGVECTVMPSIVLSNNTARYGVRERGCGKAKEADKER